MNGPTSLNQSITAAWAVSPIASSSTSSPTAGPSTVNPALKKRLKRTNLNSPSPLDASPNNTASEGERPPTPRRKKIKSDRSAGSIPSKYAPPDLRLSSLGGLHAQITQLMEIVVLPLLHPEIYQHTGVPRPRGVLLHGVPGGGKTQLVKCLAGELALPFLSISAPSIVSGMSGESEKTLRDTFDEAKKLAPCLLFLDEVDAITPKRETAQREMERRIVAQLLTCMDDLASSEEPVVVIGATNRPDSLDPALRRAGRFDHEIEMGVPSVEGREEILRVLTANLSLSESIDLRWLAKSTPGYVGADLTSLTTEAGVIAVKRIFEDIGDGRIVIPASTPTEGVEAMQLDETDPTSTAVSTAPPSPPGQISSDSPIPPPTPSLPLSQPLDLDQPFMTLPPSLRSTPIAKFLISHPAPLEPNQLAALSLTPDDFVQALKIVQPSAKREGFATIPDVSWADIGALETIRDELHMAIVQPIRHPELFAVVGIDAPSGVLLWGPPGCGKTLLAKAVANESRANFISVKGPELLNKYVGESEKAVRQVFARARASSPCVIFFDELDALVPRRDDSMSESSARVVNTLLTELDGLNSRKAVYVIGATNRPDMIDPAMVRPGRLDKLLYVDLPSSSERWEILKTHTKRTPIPSDHMESIRSIVESDKCDGFSGADIAALVREAATAALRGALQAVGAFEKEIQGAGKSGATSDGAEDLAEKQEVTVRTEHFELASKKTLPSVSKEQKGRYERMRDKYAGLPTRRRGKEKEGGTAGDVGDGGEKEGSGGRAGQAEDVNLA